jgi:hypothetical protein
MFMDDEKRKTVERGGAVETNAGSGDTEVAGASDETSEAGAAEAPDAAVSSESVAAGETAEAPETAGPVGSAHSAEPADSSEAGDAAHSGRPDRAGLLAGAAVLAACGGLVLYGVLNTGSDGDGKPQRRTPTAAVTYEVTGEGTADLTYQARSTSGEATVVKVAALPWRKTVDVPLGKAPLVTITLGEKGGRASCQLTVRGRHVQTATAFGKFGRATCQGELPSPEPSDAYASGPEGS